jgi:signal transduction histidine kinase
VDPSPLSDDTGPEPLVANPGPELVEFGRGLARATSIDDVIKVVAEVAGPLLRAANATALLLDESKSKLVVYHGPAARTQAVRVVDLTDPTPAAHVVRTGEPVYLASLDELCVAFPRFVEQVERIDWAALAVLPLLEGGELFGVVVYRWTEDVEFTPERRDVIETISELVGHALARARNHDHLVAYTRRLRDSNRDLDSFAAAVAHDLRQPLRQLSSYIDVLFEHLPADQLDEDATHYAERIRVSVERADRLIVALLGYARAGGKPMTDEEVALEAVARDVVDGLRVRLDEAGATVSIGELPTVQGDPALFHQVLQNLIDNAAKYRDPTRSPEVVVSAERKEGDGDDGRPWWRISVRDNGVGVSSDQAAKVFDVFTRAQHGTRVSGTGIGLATAKRVVERHGGTIGVDSTPGEGSTFWFTLPGVAGRHRY